MSDTTSLFRQLVERLVGPLDAIGSYINGQMMTGNSLPRRLRFFRDFMEQVLLETIVLRSESNRRRFALAVGFLPLRTPVEDIRAEQFCNI